MKSSVIVLFDPVVSTFIKHSTFSETGTENIGKLFPLMTWIAI